MDQHQPYSDESYECLKTLFYKASWFIGKSLSLTWMNFFIMLAWLCKDVLFWWYLKTPKKTIRGTHVNIPKRMRECVKAIFSEKSKFRQMLVISNNSANVYLILFLSLFSFLVRCVYFWNLSRSLFHLYGSFYTSMEPKTILTKRCFSVLL